jgi:hypothetical protein
MAQDNAFEISKYEITMYEMMLIQTLFFALGYIIGLDHPRRMEWFSYLWHIFMLIYLSMILKFITYMIQKYIETLY